MKFRQYASLIAIICLAIVSRQAMSIVGSATLPLQYDGDDSTVAFPITFKFFNDSDIEVLLYDETADTETVVSTSDYTITGGMDANGDPQTGTLTMDTAPESDQRLTILRSMTYEQDSDYIAGDPFSADTHEHALDKSVMMNQQTKEMCERAIKVAKSDTSRNPAIEGELVSGRILQWDGSVFQQIDPATIGASGMSNPMTTSQDIIVGGASGAPGRVGVGTEGQVLSVSSGNVAWSTLGTATLADLSVTTAKLADSAVTTIKIADSNVTAGKLATDAAATNLNAGTAGALNPEALDLPHFHGSLPPDLVITNNSGTPNSQMDIDWALGGLFVRSATSVHYLQTGNLTVDITASGANGKMSAAAEASSTFYFIWVIYNPGSDTAASGLHTASDWATASADFPSGYTMGRLVGAVRNDGSSNFLKHYQKGRVVLYDGENNVSTSMTATTFTDLDLSSFVPSISTRAYVSVWVRITSTSGSVHREMSLRRNGSSGIGIAAVNVTAIATTALGDDSNTLWIDTDSSQIIEYDWDGSATTTFTDTSLGVIGYEANI